MRLHNVEGTPLDPVPFLVTVVTAFTVAYSFGPVYFLALGLSLANGVTASTVAFLASAGVAFHQQVWTYRPERREEVPAKVRFRRLVYVLLVAIAGSVLLSLPLVYLSPLVSIPVGI